MHSPWSTFPVTGVLMALIVAGVLLVNAPPGLAGTVNVSFIQPENFSDASLHNDKTTAPKASRSATQLRRTYS